VLAAAAFSAAVECGSRNTSDAADAARFPLCSIWLLNWVSALAAADLSSAVDFGLLSTLDACEATLLLVSLAISLSSFLTGITNPSVNPNITRTSVGAAQVLQQELGS